MALESEGVRPPMGLALSGGGFRASLFHLGVLRRLWELGVLPGAPARAWQPGRITHISAVSGGAITAALYALTLAQQAKQKLPLSFVEFQRALLVGIKKNLRRRWLLLRVLLPAGAGFWAADALGLYLPRFEERWQTIAVSTVAVVLVGYVFYRLARSLNVMSRLYRGYFYSQARVGDLLDFPKLMINTTSLNHGSGILVMTDYVEEREGHVVVNARPSAEVRLADAVAASTAVPAIFDNYRFPGYGFIVDGGVWDNQGLSVFFRDPTQDSTELVPYLIVSDASQPLERVRDPRRPYTLFPIQERIETLLRSGTITFDRARHGLYDVLRHKWFLRRLVQFAAFHTLPDMSAPGPYDPVYSLPFANELIPLVAGIRTDLDSFSDLEIRTLMYHGYSLANYAIFSHCWDVLGPQLAALVIVAKQGLTGLTFNRIEDLSREELNRLIAAPLPWDMFTSTVPAQADIPRMKTWDEFNAELDRETGNILRSRRWRRFGQNPYDRALRVAALRHLRHSGTKLAILRAWKRAPKWVQVPAVLVAVLAAIAVLGRLVLL